MFELNASLKMKIVQIGIVTSLKEKYHSFSSTVLSWYPSPLHHRTALSDIKVKELILQFGKGALKVYMTQNIFYLFERPFKIQKNGVFLFEISFFVLEITTTTTTILYLTTLHLGAKKRSLKHVRAKTMYTIEQNYLTWRFV